jgi:hypothetical protein
MTPTRPHWEPHPLAELFPAMTPDEKTALRDDMLERQARGLDPLEHPILLYEGKILDGRHRHGAWAELAATNVADGFFAQNSPPSATFAPSEHGTLTAWLRAKSLNMVQRQIPADQKAAILLKAADTYPEIRAAITEIKTENAARLKSGRPLGASAQRGNTNKQIGELAKVGETTMKDVKRLKATNPDGFEELCKGKTTLKKALPSTRHKAHKQPTLSSEVPHNTTPVTSEVWDIAFEGYGFVPTLEGKTSQEVQNGLQSGALKLVLTGHLETREGIRLADLTALDSNKYQVSAD